MLEPTVKAIHRPSADKFGQSPGGAAESRDGRGRERRRRRCSPRRPAVLTAPTEGCARYSHSVFRRRCAGVPAARRNDVERLRRAALVRSHECDRPPVRDQAGDESFVPRVSRRAAPPTAETTEMPLAVAKAIRAPRGDQTGEIPPRARKRSRLRRSRSSRSRAAMRGRLECERCPVGRPARRIGISGDSEVARRKPPTFPAVCAHEIEPLVEPTARPLAQEGDARPHPATIWRVGRGLSDRGSGRVAAIRLSGPSKAGCCRTSRARWRSRSGPNCGLGGVPDSHRKNEQNEQRRCGAHHGQPTVASALDPFARES